MARRGRDYRAEYRRRQALARQRGFESYYGQRVRGGARAASPGEPRPRGEALRRARGHAARADLEQVLRSGRADLVLVNKGPRDARGRFEEIEILVTMRDGSQRRFFLRGRQVGDPATLRRIAEAIDAGGGPDRIQVFGSPAGLAARIRGDEDEELEEAA